jgi:UDP-glucose 4-epimerase
MKIVVTGASGNVGTALLRRFAADPAPEVVALARRVPEPAPPYDRARWSAVDIGVPGAEELLQELMRGADAVVHLAWLIQPSHDEKVMYRTNVEGSGRVFAAAAGAGVPHLVHMSSVGAYSPADKSHPVDESWPTDGVPTSYYSRHKSAAERLLDVVERANPDMTVSRPRPGLILQPAAASEIKRYFLGPLVPRPMFQLAVHRKLPVLPLPERMVMQFVHSDDIADALVRVLDTQLPGAVNLAADPVVTPAVLAQLVGARHVPIPEAVLRAAAAATWSLRLQPTSAGWVDLALSAPVLSTRRAREELGWTPRHDAGEVIRELLAGLARGEDAVASPVLRAS